YRFLPVALASLYQNPSVWSPAPSPAAETGGAAAGATAARAPAVGGAPAGAMAGDGAGSGIGKFSITGSKTLAFEVGSNRDLAVRQSLDLSLGGEVAKDLSGVAILSDRNLPLTPEGRT